MKVNRLTRDLNVFVSETATDQAKMMRLVSSSFDSVNALARADSTTNRMMI